MSNAIVPAQNAIIRTMDDAERAAISMAKSGYFTDSRDAAQAVVKILAGQEMGFGPFASMTGIYIIQGRPSVSANLMAAAVKKSGRYNYRVIEMTNEVCEIAFFEGGSEVGRSRFTLDDARKAQTKNLDKFPRNMLFARAMSNGVRWYCPDVFNGAPTYTPEELGANVNEEGEVIIDAPVVIREEPAPKNGNGKPAQPALAWDAEAVGKLAAEYSQPINRIRNALEYCNLDKPADYNKLARWMEYYKTARGKNMTPAEAGAEANSEYTQLSAAIEAEKDWQIEN